MSSLPTASNIADRLETLRYDLSVNLSFKKMLAAEHDQLVSTREKYKSMFIQGTKSVETLRGFSVILLSEWDLLNKLTLTAERHLEALEADFALNFTNSAQIQVKIIELEKEIATLGTSLAKLSDNVIRFRNDS